MTALSASRQTDALPAPLRRALPYALLVLVICAVYGNSFDNAFVFDDDLLIQLNSYLPGWHHLGAILRGSTTSGAMIAGGFYRPVQILSYVVLYNLGGGGPIPFHLFNIGLHAANACLLYRLGGKLGFRPAPCLIAVLLWAVHPLHTEAVTYMSGSADPLFVCFCLIALIRLLPDVTLRKVLTIIPLFLLGLLSKETAVMLPLLVMICLFAVSERRLDWRLYLPTWPLWLITVCFALWRMHSPDFDGPVTYERLYHLPEFAQLGLYAHSPAVRLYTFFATLPAYLSLLVWPHDLHMERSFPIFTAPWAAPVLSGFIIALLGLGIVIVAARRQGANMGRRGLLALAWGTLWFAAAHGPDSGILVPMNSLFLEHWMYLPSAGLLIGLAEALACALPAVYALSLGLIALAGVGELAVLTCNQNMVWRTPESFYSNIFRYGEQSARAHNNLALWYSQQGNYTGAIDQFSQAIAMTDSYAETRHNLALLYLKLPMTPATVDAAIVNLQRAVEIDPNFYRSWQALSQIYAIRHDDVKAKACADRAAAIIRARQ